jgi:AcrR family transcriptional regulator
VPTTEPPTAKPPTARARARAELTAEIKEVARRHLAEQGAAALSLRAVARELGMVSSAIYRYFPSRDDLLTALVVDAYDAVADAAEAAERRTARAGVAARWSALAGAVREWALADRAAFDLVYGSPVPGYQAPQDTIAPVERLSRTFFRLVADGVASGEIQADSATSIPRSVHADFSALRAFAGADIPDSVLSRGMLVWTDLFGTLSFELHGHLHQVISDFDAFFDLQMRRAAHVLVGHG